MQEIQAVFLGMKMEEDKESIIYNSLGQVEQMGEEDTPRLYCELDG